MKGATIVLILAVFLVLFCAFLVQDVEPGPGIGGKMHHLLLVGLMKIDIAIGKGMHYIHLPLEMVFRGYRGNELNREKIHRKEQRLREFRNDNTKHSDYKKKERYNRKILE